MNKIRVSALWYTLIKGTKGIWHTREGESVRVGECGIKNDRRWLVVDEHGMFIAQRKGSVRLPIVGNVSLPSSLGAGVEIRSMCQIAPRIEGDELVLNAPDMDELRLPLEGAAAPVVSVQVWSNASLTAVDEGTEASQWFSKFLSRERPGAYRLVRMTRDCRRLSKGGGDAVMRFHDGYPFMMVSDASLGCLNGKLKDVVTASRFRPNIWLRGCEAHEEDHFGRLRIGEVEFRGGTLCDRCAVICTNQETAERGKEPLATLATYRRGDCLLKLSRYQNNPGLGIEAKPNAIFFGRNLDHLTEGVIAVGDPAEVSYYE